MHRLLFTLIWLSCSLAVAATVYKWVDENGVVHYSDQPHPNAQKLHVEAAQTYKAGATAAPGPAAAGAQSAQQPAPAYQGCAVAQPTDQQTFTSIDSLTVVVRTDPGLRPGDQVYLTLDGQALNGGAPTGQQFTVSPVDRGTHVLQASIRDGEGALQCQAPGVTFYVHQPSVQSPVRPH